MISIHVPREGHDKKIIVAGSLVLISIHVPREGHDYAFAPFAAMPVNFNPRAPRGARHPGASRCSWADAISIHVPREGHDRPLEGCDEGLFISIHVPREGHDLSTARSGSSVSLFQSTCPARGTTDYLSPIAHRQAFQSTCPARGTTANMHNFFVQICARVTNIPLKGMPYLQKTYVSI